LFANTFKDIKTRNNNDNKLNINLFLNNIAFTI